MNSRTVSMFALFLSLAVPSVALSHQGEAVLPHFNIQSEQDLAVALGFYTGAQGAFPRSAIVALEGRRVLPWLLRRAQDPAVPVAARYAAIEALSYARDSLAVDVLLRLAREGDIVSRGAQVALATFPYDNVCGYWREVLAHPPANIGVLMNAVVALGYCGGQRDLPLLRSVADTASQSYLKEAAQRSLGRIDPSGNPRFAAPRVRPSSHGEYVPDAQAANAIRRAFCPAMTCDGRAFAPNTRLFPITPAQLH